MQLGVFSLTDLADGATPEVRVREIVDLGVRAGEVGMDVFGVGEHHTARFAVASPAVVLAAVAALTSRITLTSAVSVLSVLDPVRLCQDFAQLDLVSGGRAEITAGRSAYAEPFEIFGVPIDDYDVVFQEKLGLLLALRTGAPVSWSGRYRSALDGAVIVPRLARELPIRLGVGGTRESAARAGRLGLPMTLGLLSGSPERARPIVDLYRSVGADHGQPEEDLRVGVVSHLYVGRTSQRARDTFYPRYRTYFADGRGVELDRDTFDRFAAPGGPLVVGSPAEVADKILSQHEALTIDRFMGQVDLGELPASEALASIDLFASEVAPAIRRAISNH